MIKKFKNMDEGAKVHLLIIGFGILIIILLTIIM